MHYMLSSYNGMKFVIGNKEFGKLTNKWILKKHTPQKAVNQRKNHMGNQKNTWDEQKLTQHTKMYEM